VYDKFSERVRIVGFWVVDPDWLQSGSVLRIRIRDPVLFYPLDPESGSVMNFFGSRISDPGSKGYVFGEIFLRILVL
jgi:hypothetical protein